MKIVCNVTGESKPKQARFLALTEWGNVSLWSVHVLVSSEDAAGVQADAGLQFGGRVRLLLLAASLPAGRLFPVGVQASGTHKHNQGVQTHATVLAVPPNQLDQFMVTGTTDQILRGSLYGQALVPKVGCCVATPCWCCSRCIACLSQLGLLDTQELLGQGYIAMLLSNWQPVTGLGWHAGVACEQHRWSVQ